MKKFLLSAGLVSALMLAACEGGTGPKGATGASGSDGSDGHNSLIQQVSLTVGNANCPNGGIQVNSGVDLNDNDTLDSTEVTGIEYLCNAGVTSVSQAELAGQVNDPWFQNASVKLASTREDVAAAITAAGSAKNIILFVGDGMGVSTVTAARILDGQNKGMMGEENVLSFEGFPFSGLAKTYSSNQQTPDSAPTMTAMVTGVKTNDGVIGVDEATVRGDCASISSTKLVTALELAEMAGKSTGVVSTARITHATPAATYAKSPERNWEDDGDMPAAEIAAGCEDIASQLVNFETNLEARFPAFAPTIDGIEVVMGGGRRSFLPGDAAANSPDAVSTVEGDRKDGRNLVTEWTTAYPAGSYVFDQTGFDAVNAATTERLFGLFNESHMQYEADRGNDVAGEPSIAEMTSKAIDILDNNPDGFFLMVEAGRIDHAHHAGNAHGALTDTIAFADAIQAAVDATSEDDTLIIVTADHSHVFTIGGYPKRGNPILGKVVSVGGVDPSLASDGLPHTTLTYTNGLGFRDLGAETDSDASYASAAVSGRVDLTSVDTTTPGYHQEALVPLSGSETHAGEDVGVFARGPGAQLVTGTQEQNLIFHVMNYAGGLVDAVE